MKTDTLLIGGALVAAAAIVYLATRQRAARGATARNTAFVPSTGAGGVWDDMATRKYRTQLSRELAGAGDFWI